LTSIAVLATARQRNGGTLAYTLSVIEALQSLPGGRYKCVVYSTPDNREYDSVGVDVRRLPGALRVFWSWLRDRSVFGDSDLVVAPIHSLLLLAARQPFVFTLHDLQERYFPEHFPLATRIWRRFINSLLIRRAEAIICESGFVRDDIVKFFGAAHEKVWVIPAPPLALPFETDAATAASADQHPRGTSTKCLLYPAQFWPHKNHLRLVDAFARVVKSHPDCVLLLTGEKRYEHAKVFRRVEELGLTRSITHLGHVDRQRLTELYRNATVVVIPTLFESISIPVYEAFALGVPVCASAVVALPEQIGDAGLLFDPYSVDDIAAKIEMLLESAELRARLVMKGWERIEALNRDSYAATLAALIESVVVAGRRAERSGLV
jgi:glycosyltransferase involved in cell wall biosynthesis